MIGVFELATGVRRPCIIIETAADAVRPGKAAVTYAQILLAPGDMLEMAAGLLGTKALMTSTGLYVAGPVLGGDSVYRAH